MFRTIQAAAEAIRSGQATPLDLLAQCLRQIDKYEDKIKAWVFIDQMGAYEQAERLNAELKAGQYRGPLHGIPIGIKDIVDVFDWPTAAGSKLWANSIARQDATLVSQLRQAGAILLGKTVTTQYASFDPSPTRNPWNYQRTPGGSSSGSAAAVACGMCLGAIATQTGGSITRPASYCGVASCKPSYGRVSSQGVLPLAASMDHPGCVARCVWDLAVILQTIAGDGNVDATPARANSLLDLVVGMPGQSAPRLGRLRGLFDALAEPPVRSFMTQVEAQLKEHGADVEEIALPPAFSEVLTRHRTVMAVEGAVVHELRWRRHPDDYAPNITQLLKEGLACPAPEFARCKDHQHKLRAAAQHWFDGADVLLTPATTGPAPDKATTGDPAFNSPWSYTGLPTVSIPAGRSPEDLPLAIQLVGKPQGERSLLAVAAWCEKVLAQPLREPSGQGTKHG
jgi:aspartyl-tRNA(Asn)/glutamyl-tRNA(Gln) amidotransferase subunit A